MSEIIRTDHLSKSFGATPVVQDLSIHVNEGDIFGFLGVNGAGKTTTIGMLLGMIRPTNGEVFIFGQRLRSGTEPWRDVGYHFGTNDSYPNLTVEENLKIVSRYRRIKGNLLSDQILEQLNLSKFRRKKAGELSLGNLQRLSLAKTLIHSPKLLILDEPTNGLDPAAIVEVRQLLRDLADSGCTVFMSSHILSEVSQLATQIAIIHDGRLIEELATKELDRLLRHSCVIDTVNNSSALKVLKSHGINAELSSSARISVTESHAVSHPEHISMILSDANIYLKELRLEKEDLESFFLRSILP